MPKAIWNRRVQYFPKDAIKMEHMRPSTTHTV
jgi:uncharacterized protein (DUF427 family)